MPDRRPGRRVADGIKAESLPDADAVLDDLEVAALTEQLLAPDPQPTQAEVDGKPDEILALLDAQHEVEQTAREPALPRGSADLRPGRSVPRRSPTRVSGHVSVRRRRGSVLGLLGAVVAMVVVLGFAVAPTSSGHHRQPSTAVISASALPSARPLLAHLATVIAEIRVRVDQAAAAVKPTAKPTREQRTHRRVKARSKTNTVTHTAVAPAGGTVVTSSPVAKPVSTAPASDESSTPAASSGTASSAGSSTSSAAAGAGSGRSSSQSSLSDLGGIVGPSCNPTCK